MTTLKRNLKNGSMNEEPQLLNYQRPFRLFEREANFFRECAIREYDYYRQHIGFKDGKEAFDRAIRFEAVANILDPMPYGRAWLKRVWDYWQERQPQHAKKQRKTRRTARRTP
ncbi:MAG: hypothetical protein KME46_32635 [Brasilonema angustatum HA4187-MV1]|jgi:hypothetical protein|nr:hypothetical protein [Brasilonema angustatum HA4187-MV1]